MNFPNVLAVLPQGDVFEKGLADRVPVTITAHLTRWIWTVDGKKILDGNGPGRKFDGTIPKENPDCYLTTTFDHHGKRAVAVEVIWEARATFTGGGANPVTGTVHSATMSASMTALQARSRLESVRRRINPNWSGQSG